jgi:DNA-directed RNA polymerase subunit RPC12/RpoP
MKIRMGKMSARCIACSTEDWRAVDAAEPLSLFSEIVCTKCGHRALCADLALQMPLDEGQSRPQPHGMDRWNEQWLSTFKRPPSR